MKFNKFSCGGNSQLSRDLIFSFKFVASFLVNSIIAFKVGTLTTYLPVQWLLPVFSTFFLTDTVGSVVYISIIILKNYPIIMLYVYVLQLLGLGYHSYLSMTILFLFTCFLIGYLNVNIAARKLVLIIAAVLFSTIITTPTISISKLFSWFLLVETFISIAIVMSISLFILPNFAVLELHDRFNYSLCNSAELFHLLTLGMFSAHKAEADILIYEAEAVLKNITENQEVIASRAALCSYEPIGILRYFLRPNEKLFSMLKPSELSIISSTIIRHLTSMTLSISNLNFNAYHADAIGSSRESFLQLTTCFEDVIISLCGTGNQKPQQDQYEIRMKLISLKSAYEEAFKVLCHSLRHAEHLQQQQQQQQQQHNFMDHPSNNLKHLNRPIPEKDCFVVQLKEEFKIDNNNKNNNNVDDTNKTNRRDNSTIMTDTDRDTEKQVNQSQKTSLKSINEAPTIPTPIQLPAYDEDAREGPNRKSANFFLFHLSELINFIEIKFIINDDQPLPSTPLFTPVSPITVLQNIWKTHTIDVKNKSIIGLKTAFTLGIALIFVEVPILSKTFENGVWIMVAMIVCQGDNFGGTLATMRNRFFGTLFGAVFAYFVFIAVGVEFYHMLGLYVPFLLLCGVVKQHKTWSYFGTVAAITAQIVTFGTSPFNSQPLVGDYSLLRIQENTIGILLLLVCSIITIPTFAVDLLKFTVADVINNIVLSVDKVWEVYDTTVTSALLVDIDKNTNLQSDVLAIKIHNSSNSITEEKQQKLDSFISKECAAINAKLTQQPNLIEQADIESMFTGRSFSSSSYQLLLEKEYCILHMMFTLDRALLFVSNIIELQDSESAILYAKQTKDDVSLLLKEVSVNLRRWSSNISDSQIFAADGSIQEGDYEITRETESTKFANMTLLSNNISNSGKVNHIRNRDDHILKMKILHQTAIQLMSRSTKFNNRMYITWLDSVLTLPESSSSGGNSSITSGKNHQQIERGEGDNSLHDSATIICRRMTVLSAFNALFYASANLANAVIDIGNILFTISEIEFNGTYKSY